MRKRGGDLNINILGLLAPQCCRSEAPVSLRTKGNIGLTNALASEIGPNRIRVNGSNSGRKIVGMQSIVNKTDVNLAGFQKIKS